MQLKKRHIMECFQLTLFVFVSISSCFFLHILYTLYCALRCNILCTMNKLKSANLGSPYKFIWFCIDHDKQYCSENPACVQITNYRAHLLISVYGFQSYLRFCNSSDQIFTLFLQIYKSSLVMIQKEP